jgi:hypothetical protein
VTVTVGTSVGFTQSASLSITKITSTGVSKIIQADRVRRRPPRRGQPAFAPGERCGQAVAAA